MDNSLDKARNAIREADEQMAAAFEKRMKAAAEVAAYKKEHGLPIYDAAQEKRVFERNEAYVKDPALRSYYLRLVKEAVTLSKLYQHKLLEGARIAYSGVEGSFAQIASKDIFPDALLCPYAGFGKAYDAVVSGECDSAVLPIENSYAGEVGNVTDLLFNGPLFINAVYDLRISQNLLGVPGARLSDITAARSHPQALGQCEKYLSDHGIAPEEAVNTAVAAETVAREGDIHTAAIASREAAALYGLSVLDHDINESPMNTTRFAVLSRARVCDTGANTFILLFTVKNKPGALAEAIGVIGSHGFNMKALRSRPMKTLAWQYYFYVEAEGSVNDENGRAMLEALGAVCDRLRVAGCYEEIALEE